MTDGLTTNATLVYTRSEAYKKGWVLGFYDCRSDDGSPTGSRVELAHFPGNPTEDEIRDFLLGYVDAVTRRMTNRGVRWTVQPSKHRTLRAA